MNREAGTERVFNGDTERDPLARMVQRIRDHIKAAIAPQWETFQKPVGEFSNGIVAKVEAGERVTEQDLDALNTLIDSSYDQLKLLVSAAITQVFHRNNLESLVLGNFTHESKKIIVQRMAEYLSQLREYYNLQEHPDDQRGQQGVQPVVPMYHSQNVSELEFSPDLVRLSDDDLVEAVHDCGYYSKGHFEKKRPDISVEAVMPKEKIPIRHNKTLTDELLGELVTNAADAMPHGGTISLSAEQQGDYGVITVRDTGVGISVENLQRISGGESFTTKPQGTGQGLSLIRQYFEGILHGKLEITSEAGKGTTIRVLIPLATTEGESKTGEQVSPEKEAE